MPVELADELAAVAVAEVERDHMRVKLEDVHRVPAEIMAGRRVEVHVAEPRGAAHPVPVVRPRRGTVVRAAQRREHELRLARQAQ
jgi:hypothetical protein